MSVAARASPWSRSRVGWPASLSALLRDGTVYESRQRALAAVPQAVPVLTNIRHAVGVKAGIPAEKLEGFDAYEECPMFSERERAALAFAEEVTRGEGHVSDACFRRLRVQFAETEALELMFVIGYQIFASRLANAFRLAPQGFSDRAPRATVSG